MVRASQDGGGLRPAVFLDRDGVLVIPEFRAGRSFAPRRLEDFQLYGAAQPSLQRLKSAGYLLVVVTNQPDIGHGVVGADTVRKMHSILRRQLPIDLVKMCPHTRQQQCACRKPKPTLILEAARELEISLPLSFMVGDRSSDVEAGQAAGCRTVLIDLGYDEPINVRPDFVVHDVAEAVDVILRAEGNGM
jgi:D-glycero-D-manno-heptose 1,7-bisphosphate phosphatase